VPRVVVELRQRYTVRRQTAAHAAVVAPLRLRAGAQSEPVACNHAGIGAIRQLPIAAVVELETQRALSDIAREALRHDVPTTMLHAVFAGWLIALLVWMLPAAETAKVPVIVVMTWLIGVGGFAHVVAGSSEAFYAAIRGEATWAAALFGYVLPSLVGNVLGGITLVAALNHAQATSGE
jgi:formate/nitrite transporter FocA (FNT family)